MKLSDHFSLAEFTVTNTGLDNTPLPVHLPRLKIVAREMEKVRQILGDQPIVATSVYRNPKVNRKVGGVPGSDHAEAWAIDFKVRHMSALAACKLIVASGIKFDQLILERHATLIHLSFNPRMRGQILRQPGGPGTAFYQGLE